MNRFLGFVASFLEGMLLSFPNPEGRIRTNRSCCFLECKSAAISIDRGRGIDVRAEVFLWGILFRADITGGLFLDIGSHIQRADKTFW